MRSESEKQIWLVDIIRIDFRGVEPMEVDFKDVRLDAGEINRLSGFILFVSALARCFFEENGLRADDGLVNDEWLLVASDENGNGISVALSISMSAS